MRATAEQDPGDAVTALDAGARRRPAAQRGRTGPVLRRAVRIMEAFSADRSVLALSEIARRCDLPLTTTHRIVGEMVASGLLRRDAGERYSIGLKLWELGSLAPEALSLRVLALPFMEDLYEVTRENVQLAIREGLESVFLERISSHDAVRVRNRVGGRFPLYPTGVGRILLAHAPVEIQEEVLAAPLRAFTSRTVTAPSALRAMLADVRARGVAVNDGEVTLDTVSVAAPIRDRTNEVVAALAIVVPRCTASVATLAPLVRTGARGISRTLRAAGMRS